MRHQSFGTDLILFVVSRSRRDADTLQDGLPVEGGKATRKSANHPVCREIEYD